MYQKQYINYLEHLSNLGNIGNQGYLSNLGKLGDLDEFSNLSDLVDLGDIDYDNIDISIPPPLRRQDGVTYNCSNILCKNQTSNSCKMCCKCHKRGEYDQSADKIKCTYISCVYTYNRDTNNFSNM